jgi:hypothetical protein
LKYSIVKIFFALSAAEGLVALAASLWTRSMERNAWLLGFSPLRLLLGLFTALLLAGFGWLAYKAWWFEAWLAKFTARADDRLIQADWLLKITFPLIFVFLLACGILSVYTPQGEAALAKNLSAISPAYTNTPANIRSLATRALPLVVWLLLLALQTLALLVITYRQHFWQKIRDGSIYRVLLAAAVIAAGLFQWAVLYFHLKTFLVVRGWKWWFHDTLLSQAWLFIPLLAAVLILGWLVLRQPAHTRRNLFILVALGAVIQTGFGFIEGSGIEFIRVKYAGSVFNEYAWVAARQANWVSTLVNYQDVFGGRGYLGTKPPGVFLFYMVVQKIANLILPNGHIIERFISSTTLAAYVFPLFSFLVVIPLYILSKKTGNSGGSLVPGILYIACPNVILIPLFLDQVLYPLLYISILAALIFAFKEQSPWLAVISGALIYIAVYFSFSLLPLIPMAFLWAGIDWFFNRKERRFISLIKMAAGLAGGVLAAFVVFRLLLNYDPIIRYASAMAQHRKIKSFLPDLEHIYYSTILNNAEFISWTGLPVIVLFLSQAGKSVLAFMRRKAGIMDGLLFTFLATYIALNLLGQTVGEVQRLWLFMVPLVCLFASGEAKTLFKRESTGVLLVVVLQLITALLMFRYQDFYG